MSTYTPTTAEVRDHWRSAWHPRNHEAATAAFDRWLAERDAEKRAEWEAEQDGRRVFTAAYRTRSGYIAAIGGETVVREHAQKTVDDFAREDDEGPAYFLATRVVPAWMPVEHGDER